MHNNTKRIVCPLGVAGLLDSTFRRKLHNPNKILKPYIKKNMTALDIGCGPGVFSVEIANLMEGTGKVISVDMQEGMLDMIRQKIAGTPVEQTIVLHQCSQDSVNVQERVDFVLMFYMVHEVPSKEHLFNEVLPLVNQDGLVMIVEPGLISAGEFNTMADYVKRSGFAEYDKPRVPFSKSIVLQKR